MNTATRPAPSSLHTTAFTTALLLTAGLCPVAYGQSSSLYVRPRQSTTARPAPNRVSPPKQLAPAVAAASFTRVLPPAPRQFAVHDLVTIIVRESSQADSTSELHTEKKSNFDGKIDGFPNLSLRNLIKFQLKGSKIDTPIDLGVDYDGKFEGDGTYSRSDSVTGRITAQIVGVKPNGVLVLEARKSVKNDGESLEMTLTGLCRADDVAVDNTILSTQMYDLRLDKQHRGSLRKTAKKGLLTKLLDLLFNF